MTLSNLEKLEVVVKAADDRLAQDSVESAYSPPDPEWVNLTHSGALHPV